MRLNGLVMDYEEADYQAEQQAYAEAEAQQEQEYQYQMYLDTLLSGGFYELWSMEVAIDLLVKNGQGSGDAVNVLIARKNELMTLLPKKPRCVGCGVNIPKITDSNCCDKCWLSS